MVHIFPIDEHNITLKGITGKDGKTQDGGDLLGTGMCIPVVLVGEGQATSLLTSRENEIFRLYGKGLSVKHIAMELGISVSTVGSHSENIKHKRGYSCMAELLRVAYEADR